MLYVLTIIKKKKKTGWGKGIVREFGIDMYTLLYLKRITNKDLLYSTQFCTMLCGRMDGRGVWGSLGPFAIDLKRHNTVNWLYSNTKCGLPRWCSGKEFTCQCRRD